MCPPLLHQLLQYVKFIQISKVNQVNFLHKSCLLVDLYWLRDRYKRLFFFI